jgi:hypothetical protein
MGKEKCLIKAAIKQTNFSHSDTYGGIWVEALSSVHGNIFVHSLNKRVTTSEIKSFDIFAFAFAVCNFCRVLSTGLVETVFS